MGEIQTFIDWTSVIGNELVKLFHLNMRLESLFKESSSPFKTFTYFTESIKPALHI